MDSNLWQALNHFDLGRADPPTFLPAIMYDDTLANNRKNLFVRPLNPMDQHVQELTEDLPKDWSLQSTVKGRMIDRDIVQFFFESEEDLNSILRMQPLLYNGCVVAVQRWIDHPLPNYLTKVQLWVQLKNLPLQYASEAAIRSIAGTIGEVVEVDLHETSVTRPFLIRAKVSFNIANRLRYYHIVHCENGDRFQVQFYYELIIRFCFNCQRITHSTTFCTHILTAADYFGHPLAHAHVGSISTDSETSSDNPTPMTSSIATQSLSPIIETTLNHVDLNANALITIEDVLINPEDTFMADVNPVGISPETRTLATTTEEAKPEPQEASGAGNG